MKKQRIKKALVSSALALLLCVSMFIGNTFAWFTDTASTSVNTIKAGNLKVDLVDKEGKSLDGETLSFVDVKNSNDVLWEPGATFRTQGFKIVNKGNLALKYQVVITGTTGDTELLDVITFKLVKKGTDNFVDVTDEDLTSHLTASDEETALFYLQGHMDENAGNAYQGLSLDGISITVYATQYTYEFDSTTDQYDKDATYLNKDEDGAWVINTVEELFYFAYTVNSGKTTYKGETVKLNADLDLNNVAWTPIGNTSHPFNGTFDGNGHIISNLNVSGTTYIGLFGYVFSSARIDNVHIVNATVSGNDYVGAVLGGGYLTGDGITNCTVENATVIATPYLKDNGEYDGGAKVGTVAGYISNGDVKNNTAKNCSVWAYRDLGGIAGMVSGENRKVTVSGNSVQNVSTGYITVSKYDSNTPNENMGTIVGRWYNANVQNDNNTTASNVATAKSISTVEELRAFAAEVNSGVNYSGKTVILTNDIDLQNEAWTPIGNKDHSFNGTFDGTNHTISNLYINTPKADDVGLFGFTKEGEIKNLKVHNATVVGNLDVGVVAGSPYTSKYSNIIVDGLIKVDGYAYVGGVLGKNAYANVTDITVNASAGSYVKANSGVYRTYVGGVIGFMGEGNHTVKNVTSNIDVTGSTCDVGGITGIAHYGNNFVNCTSTGNVEITSSYDSGDGDEIGGIAGVWVNSTSGNVTFDGCSFTGTLKSNEQGVDLSDNTITGAKYYRYSSDGSLIIK